MQRHMEKRKGDLMKFPFLFYCDTAGKLYNPVCMHSGTTVCVWFNTGIMAAGTARLFSSGR